MKKINNIRKNILVVSMVASMSISLLGAAKVGLSNLGNTCYMNATLQVLMNSQPLNDVVEESNAQGAPLADTVENHYRALVNTMTSADGTDVPAALVAFYERAKHDSQPYDPTTDGLMTETWAARSLIPVPGRQQDAQEYLGNFFCALGPQYYSKFNIKTQKQFQCLHCNSIRLAHQIEPILILSLAIEGKTNVTECVHGFFSREVEDTPSPYCVQCLPNGDDDIPALAKVEIKASRQGLCTQCNVLLQTEAATQCTGCHRTKTTGQLKIKSCPMLLTLQLKRFDAKGHKLLTPLSIQQKLDLGDYVKEGIEGCTEYELYAIVVHGGATLGGGHYWSYVKNYDTGEWLHYNDRRVNNVSPVQMKNIAESGIDNSHLPGNNAFDLNNNATPYLLFYQRKDYAVSQHVPERKRPHKESLSPRQKRRRKL